MKEWHALHVRTGLEADIARAIERVPGLMAVAPTEQRPERRKGQVHIRSHVYMPGYVFVGGMVDRKGYHILMAIPGVIRLLGGLEYRIPEAEMRMVLALDGHGKAGRPAVCVRGTDGRVIFIGGSLARLRPRIRRVDGRNSRATLDIRVAGRSHSITVVIEMQPEHAARDALRTRWDGENSFDTGASGQGAKGEAMHEYLA